VQPKIVDSPAQRPVIPHVELWDKALPLDSKEVRRHLGREELRPFLKVDVVLTPDVVSEDDLVELAVFESIEYDIVDV
jgi:hypothetical protein